MTDTVVVRIINLLSEFYSSLPSADADTIRQQLDDGEYSPAVSNLAQWLSEYEIAISPKQVSELKDCCNKLNIRPPDIEVLEARSQDA